jgi:hypothetical protein
VTREIHRQRGRGGFKQIDRQTGGERRGEFVYFTSFDKTYKILPK